MLDQLTFPNKLTSGGNTAERGHMSCVLHKGNTHKQLKKIQSTKHEYFTKD